jgi:hypothetical protein
MSREIDIQDSIKAYKQEAYGEINSALREILSVDNIQDRTIRDHIKNIDSKMKEGKRDMVLYRGIPRLDKFLKYYSDIDEEKFGVPRIIELAFSSASRNIDVTSKFVDMQGCCIMAFTLPKEIKRYDFADTKYEDEVLIERSVQYIIESDEPTIDSRRRVKIYRAIIKPYISPRITEKDLQSLPNIEEELDINKINKKDIEELYKDLKEQSFGDITDDDIDTFVESYSHWSEAKKENIKSKLKKMIKDI